MIRIQLPWPHPDLSPNRARNVHWARKAKLIRDARRDSFLLTVAALPRGKFGFQPVPVTIPMTVTFLPPDRRRRDRTNMEGSMKAAFDGIADALGVDDNRFAPTYIKADPVQGGSVVVEIP